MRKTRVAAYTHLYYFKLVYKKVLYKLEKDKKIHSSSKETNPYTLVVVSLIT